jgi:1-acyl-sn-glycerol-3-phosphate acyltransferase
MAVADILLHAPWPDLPTREFLLACGCIPAEWSLLKRTLLSGTSVAITPAGWAESKYLQTYKLVLQRRRGFVALAAETGAHLVPVLCLGEQDLVGEPEPGYMVLKWLIHQRVKSVHVVFGEVSLGAWVGGWVVGGWVGVGEWNGGFV